jgi:hypothetical protein
MFLLFFPGPRRRALLLLLWASALAPGLFGVPARAETTDYQTKIIGKGRVYETPYFVLEGPAPGPVVLLEAGIHGDETAGVYALYRLLPRLQVQAGKLVILPRMNAPACSAFRRFLTVDLNRVFAGYPGGEPYEYALAWEVFSMVRQEGVEYVVNLHESRRHYQPQTDKNFGQTIVYVVQPMPPFVNSWLAAINRQMRPEEIFLPRHDYRAGSSTEVFIKSYRLKGGFSVETWTGLPLSRRIELQQLVVLKFLDTIKFPYSLNK